MTLTVRPIRPEDRGDWLRMREGLWPDDDHAPEVDAWLAGDRDLLPTAAVLVAERPGGGLGGFAETGLRAFTDACEERPAAYLEGIWVDEDLRRRGVATALLRAVEAWARGEGRSELGSDFHPHNAESRACHAKAGFAVVETLVLARKVL
jgi:aminoglycoside 6'-N-acetyltransferase I